MKKSEAKRIATEKLMEAVATAYYRLEDDDYSDEDREVICDYINRLGERMARSIHESYYTL